METENYEILVRDESIYTPNSADNKFTFDKEIWLDEEEDYISSKHSVVVNCRSGESHSCILLAGGGASGVHESSALVHNGRILVAVGNFVCCLPLPKLDFVWRKKTDWATCFGIYHSPKHECYISHGELDILRLTYSGEVVWQASGKDIFTGDFFLREDFIEVVDFNNERYRIDIKTGACKLTEG
ncbi:MAG: hypothetical protein M3388_17070 [Acidobacteriota bacterium]|nr:hypothetical protein [Acidobacteriota bacterium]